MQNNILTATDACCHAGKTTGHCLQDGIRHTFPARGQYSYAAPVQLCRYITLQAGKFDAICNVERFRHTCKIVFQSSIAYNDQPGLWSLLMYQVPCLE